MLNRVVVTGLGALTPLGLNVEDFWKNLVHGKSGAANITHFNAEKFKTQFACELKNFNPENFIDKKELRKIDLFSAYALIAAEQAIKDSNINLEKVSLDDCGVIWGSGIGGLNTMIQEIGQFYDNGQIPFCSIGLAGGCICSLPPRSCLKNIRHHLRYFHRHIAPNPLLCHFQR